MSNNRKDFDYTKVKIKQERPSPPRIKHKDEIADEIIPKLFAPTVSSSSDAQEEKKSVEPVKSSNEILAELFRVFNATPPESLMNDQFLLEKQKKRHKDKKHKKSKKRDASGGDESSDEDRPKKKKKKKHKKHKREREEAQTKIKEEVAVIAEEDKSKPSRIESPLHDLKSSDISDFTISSEDENTVVAPKQSVVVKKEKSPSPKSSQKIVIKSLKDSKVLAEAEKRNKNNSAKGRNDGAACSDISLSDEETYLREKRERSRSRQNYDSRKDNSRRTRFGRDNFRERSRDRNRRPWRSSRSRSRSRSRYWRRNRSRSRSRRPNDLMIDKKRLLEIARKNAISMFKNGSLPGTQSMPQDVKNKVLMKMRYGGKTVEELTDFCKKLSNGENLNDLSSLSSNEESDYDKHGNDKAFHHPFVLKDRGPIVMNIKNATAIPPKTADQSKAAAQFPVSSGQQHRLNESEWVPVPATKPVRVEPPPPVAAPKPALPKNVFEKPLPVESQQPAFKPTLLPPNMPQETEKDTAAIVASIPVPPPPTQPLPTSAENVADVPMPPSGIFPQVDVTSIITQRLNAMRKLQANPADSDAMRMMSRAQKNMTSWVNSFSPGLFTGSTGANILTPRELTAGQQAWVKRDQLITTTPVSGGMGMHLLQKMGWKPGEGLGKTKNGCLQPLLLEVKMDKRGLVTREEHPNAVSVSAAPPSKRRKPPPPTPAQVQVSVENKHPVSLLGELSSKRKWGPPTYEMVNEEGPSHRKNFTYKVVVNGMMYQPSIPCKTKKDAKALAAKYCLQQLGILPT